MSNNPKIEQPYLSIADENRKRFQTVLDQIGLPFGWKPELAVDPKSRHEDPRFWVHIHAENDKCSRTGEPMPWNSRDWILDESMTDTQIARTVLLAYIGAANHEINEHFRFHGVVINDPHIDLEKLAEEIKNEKL